MARAAASGEKKQNRVVQFWQVFQMTRKADPSVQWMLALVILLGIGVGALLGALLSNGAVFVLVIYLLIGLMLGILLAMLVLGRRAERAAFKQIEGQPGAVGAVLRTSLARGWRASEVPVAVDGRTKDAVYRAVGRPGVVLIAEGPRTRTQKLVDERATSRHPGLAERARHCDRGQQRSGSGLAAPGRRPNAAAEAHADPRRGTRRGQPARVARQRTAHAEGHRPQ